MVRVRWASSEISNGCDFAAANAYVAGIPRRACAIDDVAVDDDDVEGLARSVCHNR